MSTRVFQRSRRFSRLQIGMYKFDKTVDILCRDLCGQIKSASRIKYISSPAQRLHLQHRFPAQSNKHNDSVSLQTTQLTHLCPCKHQQPSELVVSIPKPAFHPGTTKIACVRPSFIKWRHWSHLRWIHEALYSQSTKPTIDD